MALAGMGINFMGGICYTWSIFVGGLTREFGWTQAQAALPYTVFMFCYAISMIIAGRIQDKSGPSRTIAAGGILIGAAFIISTFFMTPVSVALIWGTLFGAGLACCFASATPAAMKWFPPEKRGLVAGVVVAGMGLSALIMSPLVNLLTQHGVARAFLISGLFLGTGIVLMSRLVVNPPTAEDGASAPVTAGNGWRDAMKSPYFYYIWSMFCLTTTAGLTFATHLDRITRVQASFEQGFLMVSFFALFNAAGRPLGGYLSDKLGRIRAMTLTFTVMALVLAYGAIAVTPVTLALVVCFLGLTYGGVFSLFPAATSAYFGCDNFGFIYGLIFSAIGIAGFFPLLAGYLFDRFGNFTLTFALLSLFAALALILSLVLARSQRIHAAQDLSRNDCALNEEPRL